MRQRLLAVPLAVVATLVLATSTLAGGWAQVTLTDPPVDPGSGTPTTVALTVLQHGVTSVSWPTLTVVATDTASGKVVRTPATAKGAAGRYVATLTFPNDGSWAISFESTDLEMEGSATIQVGAVAAEPAAKPVVTAPVVTTAAPATSPDLVSIGLVGIALATLLSVIVIGVRGRNGRRDESVAASS